MSTAGDQVVELTDNAVQQGNEALDNAKTYSDNAQTAALAYITFNALPAIVKEAITVPPFDPDVNLSAEYKTDFDTIWADLEAWVRGLMADYLNTYFPTIDPAIGPAEDAWLLNGVNNGYLGFPVAVETAIWDRARARETQEALRMEEEAVSQMAARGFSLPPGVLASRLQAVQQEAANKSSTISRDIAIKQAEIAIDMSKFAIGEMTKLRLGIAQALADFIRAWMGLPGAAADISKAKADLQRSTWESSAGYLNALVNKARLTFDVDAANVNAIAKVDDLSLAAFNNSLRTRVDAATSAAEAMGRSAAAYASSQNTLAHIGDINSSTT